MTDEEFNAEIAKARAIVAAMPKWKRGILVQSASPTVAVPRKPVLNGRRCSKCGHEDIDE